MDQHVGNFKERVETESKGTRTTESDLESQASKENDHSNNLLIRRKSQALAAEIFEMHKSMNEKNTDIITRHSAQCYSPENKSNDINRLKEKSRRATVTTQLEYENESSDLAVSNGEKNRKPILTRADSLQVGRFEVQPIGHMMRKVSNTSSLCEDQREYQNRESTSKSQIQYGRSTKGHNRRSTIFYDIKEDGEVSSRTVRKQQLYMSKNEENLKSAVYALEAKIDVQDEYINRLEEEIHDKRIENDKLVEKNRMLTKFLKEYLD